MNEPSSEKLKFTTKLAYGAGDLGPAITANILVFYLLPFFTNVAGLNAGLAGTVLMLGKISDAINDPLVGILSDRTRTPWGRRLPWMFFGTIPFGLVFVLQWIIPHFSDDPGLNNWLLFAYYVLIGIVFNIFFTAVNLPYTALTPELTQDYNERTNLNSFRFTFSIGGSIVSLILAVIIFNLYEDPIQQYLILGILCSILSTVALFWCIFRIQERGARPILNQQQQKFFGIFLITSGILGLVWGVFQGQVNLSSVMGVTVGLLVIGFGYTLLDSSPESHLIDENAIRQRAETNNEASIPFAEQLKVVFANKPFLYVIGIYLCSWLAVQLTASILIFFVVNWMGLSNSESSKVALAVQGTALVLLFFWKALSDKLGKKVVYFMGTALWMIAQAGLFLLQPGQVVQLYVLAIIAGFGVSVAYLIPWSMVPDVIELDELQTGQRREGVFYGFMVLLQKVGLALALFLVGIILNAAGFIEAVAGQPLPTQPESALLAIRLAIGPVPTIALIGGLVLAYFYPITKEFHQQIRLQLSERKAAEQQS